MEALTRGIISKIMHTPISTLKTAVREAEATTVVDVVRRLFDLRDRVQEKELQGRRKEDQNAAKSGSGESGAET